MLSRKTKALPLALGVAIASTMPAFAGQVTNNDLKQLNNTLEQNKSLDQVNNVFQLRDVAPSDWAFDALRNLVDRYNCLQGYPDRTFRGNAPLKRYEFAAGLNACMAKLEAMIAGGDNIDPNDLASLRRMAKEFEAELAALGARVDDLEGRTKFLEDHQFSTTTKLKGEAIFTLGDAFSGNAPKDQVFLTDRVRLNLNTSFTGKDNLLTRIEVGNHDNGLGTTGGGVSNMARLGHDTLSSFPGNAARISDLYYTFPVNNKLTAMVGTAGLDLDDVFDSHNPYLYSSGTGSVTRFLRFDPLTMRSGGDKGLGLIYQLGKSADLRFAYLADNAQETTAGKGLFNGNYSLGAQLNFKPHEFLDFGLVYRNAYYSGVAAPNLTGSTTNSATSNPFAAAAARVSADSYGLQANWQVFPKKVNLAGWVSFMNANRKDAAGKANLNNWMASVSFLDAFAKGNVFTLGYGQPPKVTGGTGVTVPSSTSHILEAQYKFKSGKNITFTPAVYAVFNPEHTSTNKNIWVGVLRTTFSF